MDRDKLKKRISERFRKKPVGRIVITINKKKKIAIEYMYGGKFCLKRKESNKITTISLLCDLDKLVELIIKEKTRIF